MKKVNGPDYPCTGGVTTVTVGEGAEKITVFPASKMNKSEPFNLEAGVSYVAQDINEIVMFKAVPKKGNVPANGVWLTPIKGNGEGQILDIAFIDQEGKKQEEDKFGEAVKATKDAQTIRNERLDAMLTSFGF